MTTAYRSLSPEALRREYAEVSARFDALRELGLALNIRHIDHTARPCAVSGGRHGCPQLRAAVRSAQC